MVYILVTKNMLIPFIKHINKLSSQVRNERIYGLETDLFLLSLLK